LAHTPRNLSHRAERKKKHEFRSGKKKEKQPKKKRIVNQAFVGKVSEKNISSTKEE